MANSNYAEKATQTPVKALPSESDEAGSIYRAAYLRAHKFYGVELTNRLLENLKLNDSRVKIKNKAVARCSNKIAILFMSVRYANTAIMASNDKSNVFICALATSLINIAAERIIGIQQRLNFLQYCMNTIMSDSSIDSGDVKKFRRQIEYCTGKARDKKKRRKEKASRDSECTAVKNIYFPWPSTEYTGLETGIVPSDARRLSIYGYGVGVRNTVFVTDRRRILDGIIMSDSVSFGSEKSALELKWVANLLAALVRRANGRTDDCCEAIRLWESDLDYLHKKYYLRLRFG